MATRLTANTVAHPNEFVSSCGDALSRKGRGRSHAHRALVQATTEKAAIQSFNT